MVGQALSPVNPDAAQARIFEEGSALRFSWAVSSLRS
jgi:hypothetical protein